MAITGMMTAKRPTSMQNASSRFQNGVAAPEASEGATVVIGRRGDGVQHFAKAVRSGG